VPVPVEAGNSSGISEPFLSNAELTRVLATGVVGCLSTSPYRTNSKEADAFGELHKAPISLAGAKFYCVNT
jgi:hypothetical protein